MDKFWLCLLTLKRFCVVHGAHSTLSKCFSTTLVNYKASPLAALRLP